MAKGHTVKLYPSDTLNVSSTYSLLSDFGIITIGGWSEGDSACIERRVSLGPCQYNWVPYAPTECGQEVVSYPTTNVFIAIPGDYRFVFKNENDEHLTNPDWFEELYVTGDKVSSNVDLSAYLKGNDMACCSPTISDIKAMIEMCLAGQGGIIDTNTTVESLSFDPLTSTLSLVDSDGGVITVVIPSNIDTDTTVTSLSFDPATSTLTMTDSEGDEVSVVIPAASGTDTFTTLSGQTLTLPDGQTITVPSGSSYNAVTNEITLSDGSVVALPVDTDTDTFATFTPSATGGTITFADGQTLLVDNTPGGGVDTDTVCTFTQNADGTVTKQLVDALTGDPIGAPQILGAAASVVTSNFDGTEAGVVELATHTSNGVTTSIYGYGLVDPSVIVGLTPDATFIAANPALVDVFANPVVEGQNYQEHTSSDGTVTYVPVTAPVQTLFKAGDVLPADMVDSITITVLLDPNDPTSRCTEELFAGDTIPADYKHCITVDAVTRCPCVSEVFGVYAGPSTGDVPQANCFDMWYHTDTGELLGFVPATEDGDSIVDLTSAVRDPVGAVIVDGVSYSVSLAANWTVADMVAGLNAAGAGPFTSTGEIIELTNGGNIASFEVGCVSANYIFQDSEDFETPLRNNIAPTASGNNFQGSSYGLWYTQNGANMNVVRGDGVSEPAGIGPAVGATGGVQYIDIAGTTDFMVYDFTLTNDGFVELSAYLSNRQPLVGGYIPWTGQVEILDVNDNVIHQGNSIDFDSTVSETLWFQSTLETPLAAGNYRFRIYVDNFGHIDDVSIGIRELDIKPMPITSGQGAVACGGTWGLSVYLDSFLSGNNTIFINSSNLDGDLTLEVTIDGVLNTFVLTPAQQAATETNLILPEVVGGNTVGSVLNTQDGIWYVDPAAGLNATSTLLRNGVAVTAPYTVVAGDVGVVFTVEETVGGTTVTSASVTIV